MLIIQMSDRMTVGKEGYMLGIDEAGRGPVLGPMVYGCSFCPISFLEKLKKFGFKDSKVLSEEEREELFAKIKTCPEIFYLVDVISAKDISAQMLRRHRTSLNEISHNAAIALIRQANEQKEIKQVYIDTVGDPEKYQEKLQAIFPSMEITVTKKADSLFPIVSAASICAKVTRDHCVRDWDPEAEPVNKKLARGSGYPADPETKEWLQKHLDPVFGFPSFVRFSWQTTKTLLTDKACVVSWGDEDDQSASASSGSKRSHRMTDFFSHSVETPAAGGVKPIPIKKRAKYFQHRHLTPVLLTWEPQ
eukprot:g64448.t1